MDYLLGIDIGTSACKGAVFIPDGTIVQECDASYDVDYPLPGYAQQQPEVWWDAVCKVCNTLFASGVDAKDIKGVGLSGQSWSAVPLTKDGRVLYPSPIWLDNRANALVARLLEKVDGQRIFDLCGNVLRSAYTLPKVLWLKENHPDIYRQIDKVLQSNSYIAYMLTGVCSQDVSQGYGWQCFDIRKGRWDEKMADELGVDLSMLPDISPCHEIIGTVTAKAARATGLRVGTPVTAGGLDATNTALGCGVLKAGQSQEQGGSSGGVGICLDNYADDPRLIQSFHVVPDKWLLQGGTVAGGINLKWFSQQLAAEEQYTARETGKNVFSIMSEEARQIPPGCEGVIFLPYMAGERCPVWDTNAQGVFFGLGLTKTRAHMIRAVMESVAYSSMHNIMVANNAGVHLDEVYSGGGAARSDVWMQIKADAIGRPVHVPASTSAAALGAAMLAGVGTGLFKDFDEAVASCVHVQRTYEPDEKAHAVYLKNFEIYLDIYEDLKNTMKKAKESLL